MASKISPIPDWYVGPGVVPTETKSEVQAITPPGPDPARRKWFEPLFLKLRETGDRMRWINDEVWILPSRESNLDWYRDPMRLGPVEMIAVTYFDKSDDLRQKIIAAYHGKVFAVKPARGLEEAHRIARNHFTLRGCDWNGERDWDQIELACKNWNLQ